MREKTQLYYECEYCGEKAYSKHEMIAHEEDCYKNPNRIACGNCKKSEVNQRYGYLECKLLEENGVRINLVYQGIAKVCKYFEKKQITKKNTDKQV